MSERMDPAVKAKWLAALRSGDYLQARDDLRVVDEHGVDSYCCLGVLCDLYRKDVGGAWGSGTHDSDGTFRADNGSISSGSTLNETLHRWAGVPVSRIRVHAPDKTDTLAELNDMGCSFSEIADLIEEEM